MTDKATPSLRQRCDTALQSLPDAAYKTMLAALFDDLLGLAAQAAPTEPPQEFESAQGRALASAWAEGWVQCRDAEYIGEEAQNEAFNQSHTLAQCLHADQTRFQGGLSNDQLRRTWGAKLPNVIPTEEQLTAFALGIEAAAQPSQAPVVQAVRATHTTGHCKEHTKPGGCQLHNLHCGWPDCDRRPIEKFAAPEEQAVDYPPLPEELLSELWNRITIWDLSEGGDGAAAAATRIEDAVKGLMRAYVDAARASSGATAQAVRMLTEAEQTAIIDMHNTGRAQGDHECAEDIQHKFAEVNGLRIPADGKIGSAA